MNDKQISDLLDSIRKSGANYSYNYHEGEDGTIWFTNIGNINTVDLHQIRLHINAITLYLKYKMKDIM